MKHIEKSLVVQLGNKNTLENIVGEYECVLEVLGYDLFMKVFSQLVWRTCDLFNIYDDHVFDFTDYMKFRLGLPTEEE